MFRERCRTIWPRVRQAIWIWMDVSLILPSLRGLCNMAKDCISAYLALQLSPTSKVRDDKQEANCKAIKRIEFPLFQRVE